MKIRMKTIAAGPGFNASPRQIVDRPADEARRLVDGGFAEFVEPADEAAAAPKVEEATAPAAETAEAPEGKKGRKGR